MHPYLHCLVLLTLVAVLPVAVSAVDGVLEINQACAATGCFPGDAPGFPVTIDRDQTGSYRLTSNLVNLDPVVTTIVILDFHVTLDLNGFALSGPTVCTGVGAGLSCTPTGAGDGIDAFGTGVVVRNGTVRGMAYRGIALAGNARVEGVHAVSNGAQGVSVGNGSLVTRCRIDRNGAWGVDAGIGSVLRHNVVFGNQLEGVSGAVGVISGNVVRENGSSAGFLNADGKLIVDNVMTDNGSYIYFPFGNPGGYARNVLRNVPGGAEIDAAAVEIGPNLCGSNTTCP